MNRGIFLVTAAQALYQVYLSLILIFGVVFFYQFFGENILKATLPMSVAYFCYAALVGFSGRFIGKIGTRYSLIVSLFFFGLAAASIYYFDQSRNILYFYGWLASFFAGKLLFHVPNIYLLGESTDHGHRGSQIGYRHVTFVASVALTPFVGGFISQGFGFLGIVALGTGLLALAIIPILMLPNQKFDVTLGFNALLKRLSARKLLLINLIQTVQDSAQRIWPIYLFLMLRGSFSYFGIIVGITSGVSMISLLVVGKFLNKHDRYKSLKYVAQLLGLTWIIRAAAATQGMLITGDLLGRFMSRQQDQVVETVNYDLMTDDVADSRRDEMVIAREIGLDFSIGLAWLVTGAIAHLFGFQAAFIFSAAFGLLMFLV